MNKQKGDAQIILTSVVAILFIAFLFWVFPMWNVWSEGLSGEAALNKAEQTKKIMIQT